MTFCLLSSAGKSRRDSLKTASPGMPPPMPGIPAKGFLRRLPFFLPPPDICRKSFCICSFWRSTRLTSDTSVPLPAAMRRLREGLMSAGFVPLGGGHRVDDRLDLPKLLLPLLGLVVADLSCGAGEHIHHARERAHLFELLHLFEHVVEIKGVLLEPLGHLGRLLGVEIGLRLLDEGEHVAHARGCGRPCGRDRRARGPRAFRRCPRT